MPDCPANQPQGGAWWQYMTNQTPLGQPILFPVTEVVVVLDFI
ncbi:MAG: hypothetical protein ACI8PQ_003009, partial [Planctomycetota bacterium]